MKEVAYDKYYGVFLEGVHGSDDTWLKSARKKHGYRSAHRQHIRDCMLEEKERRRIKKLSANQQ